MLPIGSDPHGVQGENGFPFHACCGDCAQMNIQINGDYWCTEYNDEVDADHVCERWSQG